MHLIARDGRFRCSAGWFCRKQQPASGRLVSDGSAGAARAGDGHPPDGYTVGSCIWRPGHPATGPITSASRSRCSTPQRYELPRQQVKPSGRWTPPRPPRSEAPAADLHLYRGSARRGESTRCRPFVAVRQILVDVHTVWLTAERGGRRRRRSPGSPQVGEWRDAPRGAGPTRMGSARLLPDLPDGRGCRPMSAPVPPGVIPAAQPPPPRLMRRWHRQRQRVWHHRHRRTAGLFWSRVWVRRTPANCRHPCLSHPVLGLIGAFGYFLRPSRCALFRWPRCPSKPDDREINRAEPTRPA